MSKNKLFKIWRLILPFLFIFFVTHFLKDITQDIFRIKTPLDIFGDVKEDLSKLPSTLQYTYLYGLGGLSFLLEAFLLIGIPLVLKREKFSKLEKVVVVTIVFLLVFFIIATLLDPRY